MAAKADQMGQTMAAGPLKMLQAGKSRGQGTEEIF
jgi:hypothetical protein